MLSNIYQEIADERAAQDKEWGGPIHDDRHTNFSWNAYFTKHLGKAIMWPFDKKVWRRQMIIVAALAVAAIEWVDRRP